MNENKDYEDGNFSKGIFFALLIEVEFIIIVIGWIKLISALFNK